MQITLKIDDNTEAQGIFGLHDENIKFIEDSLKVKVFQKNLNIVIKGTSVKAKKAKNILEALLQEVRSGRHPSKKDVSLFLKSKEPKKKALSFQVLEEKNGLSFDGKSIGPKTKNQRDYVDAIRKHDIVFGIGPAGTGKTYLAMAMAVEALRSGLVRRIILTRPAIEAGENLGFLPGDMYEKISPYLRPLYDAIYDMMDPERIEKYLETSVIEVAPLGYMRGRTLNDAFIILDEAQNCTSDQLKMFLTRLGFDSKTVITGDLTQSDLPGGKPTGLLHAQNILSEVEGIKFIYLTGQDVVRHELVQRIIEAYDRDNKKDL